MISSVIILTYYKSEGSNILLPDFNLSEDNIYKLQHRFNLFQRERKIIHDLLNNYVADYRQFSGTPNKRFEYLRKKYIAQTPDLSHLVFNEEIILWSLEDISIILGRHLSTITRTFEKLEQKSEYYSKLIALRKTIKAKNGHNIYVYNKEIFDLIIDLYEDEYLQRFSLPRRGNINNAPDLNEVKRFWEYLKELENYNNHLINKKVSLPDIPSMKFKDIISLIWKKVFDVKIWTVSSVIFAICFEITRRFFDVNLWVITIPAVIVILCVILIHRKFKPDILSDLGASALLFMLLWISAALSVDKLKPETKTTEPKITLSPMLAQLERVDFYIMPNFEAKEFFYRISPDKEFHSTGLMQEINPLNNLHYPNLLIKNLQTEGIMDIDIKYLDQDNNESKIWNFSFDVGAEKFKFQKNYILNLKDAWVAVLRLGHDEYIYTTVDVNDSILFDNGNCIDNLVYGINKTIPDTVINLIKDKEKFLNGYSQLLFDKENYIKYVSSYLIFKDGSSSDIRISRVE